MRHGSETLISTFDRAGRLTEVDDDTKVTTNTYDANGNRKTETAANGVTTYADYDALNRVGTISAEQSDSDNVYATTYHYDLASQRRGSDEEVIGLDDRHTDWTYDGLYRLTNESWANDGGDSKSSTYTYDVAGNRLSFALEDLAHSSTPVHTITYAYDDLNELTSSEKDYGAPSFRATTYAYDLNGNRTQIDAGGTGDDVTYVYDTSDRLIEADDTNTSDVLFTATYDARTRRLSKFESGDTTSFRYDGGTNFQELNDDGDVTKELVRAGGMGGGIGSILYTDESMRDTPGPVEFFTYNAVGNTVAVTDEDQDPTQTSEYDAFGETITQTGSSDNNRLRNTKERDASIGLDNDGFRYYDPATGTYIQRDPTGYADGLNVYTSVHDNPVNGVDPQGLNDFNGIADDNAVLGAYLRGLKKGNGGAEAGAEVARQFDEGLAARPDAKGALQGVVNIGAAAFNMAAAVNNKLGERMDVTDDGGGHISYVPKGQGFPMQTDYIDPNGIVARIDPDIQAASMGFAYLGVGALSTAAMLKVLTPPPAPGGGGGNSPAPTGNAAASEAAAGDGIASDGMSQLQKNSLQGKAFERTVKGQLEQTQTNVVEQITVKTPEGTRTRLDFMGNDPSGAIAVTEAKSSQTAPLTQAQSTAFPQIEQGGATVVGEGKPPFVGGTVIPPTKVNVVRPPQ